MQLTSVIVPIVVYLADLLFIKNEILVDGRTVAGNPMGIAILTVAVICVVLAVIPLVKRTGKAWISWLGIILNILLILVSVF